jgi:singapore isolate B (sub-type 7) whole genome shotgun sequence assembly, scaffold_4
LTNIDAAKLRTDAIITSKTFHQKVVGKLKYIQKLVATGYRVLYMDCDIILFKNPWPVLSSFSEDSFDIVAQRDYTLNSGFMLLFPTETTYNYLGGGVGFMLMNKELDQESLIAVMGRYPSLRLHLLPENQFSNGHVFFQHHQFYWDPITPEQIMMHNNFIVGSDNKYYRWREMNFYNEDTDMYYSSPTRQYLMVDASDERKNNTLYLHQVAVLSRLLNRTFLLPTFACPPEIHVDRCNLCRNDVECFKRFRNLIGGDFRAYVRSVPLFNIGLPNERKDADEGQRSHSECSDLQRFRVSLHGSNGRKCFSGFPSDHRPFRASEPFGDSECV